MPAAPLLRVRDLTITHRGASDPAVRDVSFEVHAGEVVLLLGPSGSGKSTLALALSGLIPHSLDADASGSVEACGHDVATTPIAALTSAVSTVFQDPDAQIVTGSVLDDAAFALENLRFPVAEVLARSEAALRRMGLWERRAENPDRLSGGGKQRLAIASALATGSPLLILDEPTANLDPQGTADVHAALADIAGSEGRALILVEHDLDAALEIATRAIVLDGLGRIAFDGPARRILREHAEEILALGAWLPSAALAARRLCAAGIPIGAPGSPLPLTADELRSAFSRFEARTTLDPTSGSSQVRTSKAETEPVISVRGLEVRRGRKVVLRGVDLDIESASITAIIGRNGAGKTTLVQALAGVVTPPRGRISVDGIDPAVASPRTLAAHIGFVFQNPEHQFIAHTVFDELAHGLRLRRTPPAEIDERVGAMLARFGLTGKAEVHPFLLSGGEKRRLSVGTALITRPRILVLDEPTFGQDRARTEELLALFRELRAEGTTIVLVTHDMDLVVQHASRTVLVEDGRIVAAGATSTLVRDALIPLPAAYLAVPPDLRPLLGDEAVTGSEAITGSGLGTIAGSEATEPAP
ncbi:ATP-binding cassette domain-containing protein [Microbacterium sp. 13-71-7]|uniref:ABC transporter ATP-binding protein n=1 Tax=Microbacterium sp. 13-71-7 TaxID=1970399 RepID=UPI000BD52FAB|nr:ATP-binding cassette domain-containing protein [Microbacterium sp. 13-71-7]OZB83030.1 MAG: ABC transporter ATP-binding protein [Microbacterium sp. 13-71-7]